MKEYLEYSRFLDSKKSWSEKHLILNTVMKEMFNKFLNSKE